MKAGGHHTDAQTLEKSVDEIESASVGVDSLAQSHSSPNHALGG